MTTVTSRDFPPLGDFLFLTAAGHACGPISPRVGRYGPGRGDSRTENYAQVLKKTQDNIHESDFN